MIKKGTNSRLIDIYNYLDEIGFYSLSIDLFRILHSQPKQIVDGISNDISLGTRVGLKNDAETQRRRALRALLLCQRVYLSTLTLDFDELPSKNWVNDSINYWKNKEITEINKAIELYLATSDDPQLVSVAAKNLEVNGLEKNQLNLTRASSQFPVGGICYDAVMCWLLKSGLVSYVWFMKNINAKNETDLRKAFGYQFNIIWGGNKALSENDPFPIVPKGHIVHLYHPESFNGHWLISNGDGTACGVNNDMELGRINRVYDSECSIKNQFLHGFKRQYNDPKTGKKLETPNELPGIAATLDPRCIAYRGPKK